MIRFKSILISCLFLSLATISFAQLYIDPEGNVGVGLEDSPDARMTILNNTESTGLLIDNAAASGSTQNLFGLKIEAKNGGQGQVYGLQSIVSVNSNSFNNQDVYGLYSWVTGMAPGIKYGVYSIVNVGEGYAGFFEGDVMITGDLFYSGGFQSDEETTKLTGALALIEQLEAKYSLQEGETANSKHAPQKVGFSVQEVKQVMPNIVKSFTPAPRQNPTQIRERRSNETSAPTPSQKPVEAIDYNALIPILAQGIKEQQELIKQLQEEVALLKSKIDN